MSGSMHYVSQFKGTIIHEGKGKVPRETHTVSRNMRILTFQRIKKWAEDHKYAS